MTSALLLFGLSIGLLALRLNLVVTLLTLGSLVHLIWGDGEPLYLIQDMWIALDKELLLSVPLFLLCGTVIGQGAIAARMIDIMSALTAPLPGGLGVATILACAIFSAVSGSSVVTLLAVGSVAYPALLRQGYAKSFSLGAVATAGTLGVIIPPSIPLILFGIATETSILDLFKAGILPGMMLAILLSTYAFFSNRHMKKERFSMGRLVVAIRNGTWALLMPVILLGGIYSGYFSPTEAAAVAALYAVVIECFVYRELSFSGLRDATVEVAITLGSIFPILAIALSMNLLLVSHQVPMALADWIETVIASKITFLLAVNLLLLAIGCVLDMMSAIVILAPLLVSLGRTYGIDPVHLGIIMIINLEIGLLTPPLGINLIVAMGAFQENFGRIVRSVLPFLFIMMSGLLIVTFVPGLSLIFR